METYEAAKEIAKTLLSRKARDIVLIDIAEKSAFADFFVNCTAGSDRQMDALKSYVEETAFKLGLEEKGIEGREGSGWILMDYGDVIVNIFTGETRDRYALDKIWGDCKVERVEE